MNSSGTFASRVRKVVAATGVSRRLLKKSRSFQEYNKSFVRNTTAIEKALTECDFEQLVEIEQFIQREELDRYDDIPAIKKSVEQGIKDFNEGLKIYRLAKEQPEVYRSLGFRDRDRTGAGKRYPYDTMRKALRSQATRVLNFSRNPLLSAEEVEYHNARASLLRKMEKLYEDDIQTPALFSQDAS